MSNTISGFLDELQLLVLHDSMVKEQDFSVVFVFKATSIARIARYPHS